MAVCAYFMSVPRNLLRGRARPDLHAGALFELAKKANATAPIDCAPAPPTPQVCKQCPHSTASPHARHQGTVHAALSHSCCPSASVCLFQAGAKEQLSLQWLRGGYCQQVYLGEQYVNNLTLSDVTFLVEGQTFHAHRIALLASSDTFRAMFDGHYKEKEASTIPIPNIRYAVFESMMRCIYTGACQPQTLLQGFSSPHTGGACQDNACMLPLCVVAPKLGSHGIESESGHLSVQQTNCRLL